MDNIPDDAEAKITQYCDYREIMDYYIRAKKPMLWKVVK